MLGSGKLGHGMARRSGSGKVCLGMESYGGRGSIRRLRRGMERHEAVSRVAVSRGMAVELS
jgi:hypothetical protein